MTNKLRLLLLSIMGICLGLSFCSADITVNSCEVTCFNVENNTNDSIDYYMYINHPNSSDTAWFFYGIYNLTQGYSDGGSLTELNEYVDYIDFWARPGNTYYVCAYYLLNGCQGGGSSTSDIDVYYNNGNSVENVICDGVQAIQINGLSTITSTNTFTPYFNISYKDQDNQLLTESYSKDLLYLENGLFKKTYTGDNNWILTVQGNSEESFTGYLPTFEITGGINDVVDSGNIFNNFAENSVKFTLSNIPSYIQYVILLLLLFFILGFIRKFRRK